MSDCPPTEEDVEQRKTVRQKGTPILSDSFNILLFGRSSIFGFNILLFGRIRLFMQQSTPLVKLHPAVGRLDPILPSGLNVFSYLKNRVCDFIVLESRPSLPQRTCTDMKCTGAYFFPRHMGFAVEALTATRRFSV
jgi:hypothetical protein